jgi:hypothetical protein
VTRQKKKVCSVRELPVGSGWWAESEQVKQMHLSGFSRSSGSIWTSLGLSWISPGPNASDALAAALNMASCSPLRGPAGMPAVASAGGFADSIMATGGEGCAAGENAAPEKCGADGRVSDRARARRGSFCEESGDKEVLHDRDLQRHFLRHYLKIVCLGHRGNVGGALAVLGRNSFAGTRNELNDGHDKQRACLAGSLSFESMGVWGMCCSATVCAGEKVAMSFGVCRVDANKTWQGWCRRGRAWHVLQVGLADC